ncbi:MAG: hypothetical protein ACLSV2_08695 [Clostridium sp.]
MNIKEFKDLEMACKPIIDYLNENYNPYTSVVITSSEIKLVEDLAGIPVVTQTKMDMTNKKETAPEVPVREQIEEVIINLKNTKTPTEIQAVVKKILYQL